MPFTEAGMLSPELSISGGALTATYTTSTGIVTGPLGPATVTGSFTSTSGIGAGTQLIF